MKTAGSVGERLRFERERRGLNLEVAAQATRIDRAFLEALESDASPEAFPEPMYARAFLREYARYLGLKDRPLVQAYRAAYPMGQQPPIGLPPIRLERRQHKWGRRALVVGAIGALAAVAVFSARVALPPRTAEGEVPTIPAPAPEGDMDPARPQEPKRQEFRGVELRIQVLDGPCWVEVVRGDEVVLISGTQAPGFSRTFRSKSSLDIVLGAPNVTRVSVNGEPLVPPRDGGVYGASLVWEKGEVRVVPTR